MSPFAERHTGAVFTVELISRLCIGSNVEYASMVALAVRWDKRFQHNHSVAFSELRTQEIRWSGSRVNMASNKVHETLDIHDREHVQVIKSIYRKCRWLGQEG